VRLRVRVIIFYHCGEQLYINNSDNNKKDSPSQINERQSSHETCTRVAAEGDVVLDVADVEFPPVHCPPPPPLLDPPREEEDRGGGGALQ
jgi:hypothetical protein